jgi:putative acetyltransferase
LGSPERTTPTLRPAHPLEDEAVGALLRAGFQTADEERVALELARSHPAFDPSLALMAEVDGEPAGWILLLPREFHVREGLLPLAIVGPVVVDPRFQGTGVGSFLVEGALESLGPHGLEGAVLLGAPGFYHRFGFESAFDYHSVRLSVDILSEEGDTTAWRGLTGEDLPLLPALHERAHEGVSGTERRLATAPDWESVVPGAHSLVHGPPGAPNAFLRFRKQDSLEITECACADAQGVDAILRMVRRLAREHGMLEVRANVAPPHPVARSLLARGALYERSSYGDAAMLHVRSWPALLMRLARWWAPLLALCEEPALSLEIDGESVLLTAHAGRPSVSDGRDEHRHLWVPPGWACGLLTGRRTGAELLFEERVRERSCLTPGAERWVGAAFGHRSAQWLYSPAYED